MTDLETLGPDAVGAIAELCHQALGDLSPTEADLADCLFSTCGGPAPVLRGDPKVGVVASVRRGDQGFVRLLAVHPARRRQGVASALLARAEEDLAGCSHVTVGADAPDYLFPGVATQLTDMLCLMEARRYRRIDAHLNMGVDLRRLPTGQAGAVLAGPEDAEEVGAWMAHHWPHWADEVGKALRKDRLLLSRDDQGVAGFCAWDVNRVGWLGPIAVRPDAVGGGIGVPLLLGALHRMRDQGMDHAEISWISPVRFYVRNAGATISNVFVVHRRRLRRPESEVG